MPTIYDMLFLDGTPSYEIMDDAGKQKVMYYALRLANLEPQIVSHPEGIIEIRSSGIIIVDSFPKELSEAIHKALR